MGNLEAAGKFCDFSAAFSIAILQDEAQYNHSLLKSIAELLRLTMNYRSLLLCGLLGFTSAMSLSLVMPERTEAYIARQEIRVERLKDESYDAFIRRSEIISRAAIQRAFDRDVVMSTVLLFIVGQHRGMEAPVMSVEVSRSQWQARPDARVWATYYRMAQRLLGFGYAEMPDLPQGPGQVPIAVPSPVNPLSPRPGDSIPLNVRPTTFRLRLRPRLNPVPPQPIVTPVPSPVPSPSPL
jgi:hypothetical protein